MLITTFGVFFFQTLDGKALKNFKKTKKREDVLKSLATYIAENPSVKVNFIGHCLVLQVVYCFLNFVFVGHILAKTLGSERNCSNIEFLQQPRGRHIGLAVSV